MLRLHYADGSVLVSDDVGAAVLRYAQALAETHASDVVVIPVTTPDTRVTDAHFLLGPSSQLFAVPEPDAADVAPDQGVVDELDRRSNLLRPTATFSEPSTPTEFDMI